MKRINGYFRSDKDSQKKTKIENTNTGKYYDA